MPRRQGDFLWDAPQLKQLESMGIREARLSEEINETFRRTDIFVRPSRKHRGATDEDVRRTPQSRPREDSCEHPMFTEDQF